MNVTINGIAVVRDVPKAELAAAELMLSPCDTMSLRERIDKVSELLATLPQSKIPLQHEFIEGLYRRTVIFPKGFMGTGKIHKRPHMDVMLTGEMLLMTEDGYKHVKAPFTMVTQPGQRKGGIALEETIWSTYHATDTTSIKEVEEEIMCDSWEAFELSAEYQDLTDIVEARADFEQMLKDLGVSAETVRRQSDNLDDYEERKLGALDVKDSVIEGKGLFATSPISKGCSVWARVDGIRGIAGRYVNHSHKPNAEMQAVESDIKLVFTRDITVGEEILVDYRKSVEVACQASQQQ